jgi:hypothetical protein
MGDLAQALHILAVPRHVAHESWWIGLPREHFTEAAQKHVFSDETERQRRRLAGIRAEQEMQDS